jgi:Ca2+-binding RTX toxin-like protein
VIGNDCDDTLWGGDRNDTPNGNNGADEFHGKIGDDTLTADADNEWLWARISTIR